MDDTIRAGTKAADGTTDPYVHSMAEAMERAFEKEWPVIMGSDKPKINNHLRLLFIAVAQGVVRHLHDNIAAFKVDVPTISGSDISIGTEEKSLKNIDIVGRLYES